MLIIINRLLCDRFLPLLRNQILNTNIRNSLKQWLGELKNMQIRTTNVSRLNVGAGCQTTASLHTPQVLQCSMFQPDFGKSLEPCFCVESERCLDEFLVGNNFTDFTVKSVCEFGGRPPTSHQSVRRQKSCSDYVSLAEKRKMKRGLTTYIQHMPAYRPLVVCGPSGSGKSTLLKRLLKDYGDFFALSTSHTTRKPRPGEVNGREYHFVTREQMMEAIERGDFIEYTEFSGNLYGTSKKAVRDVQNQRRICILDIEIEGVKNVRNTDLNPHLVFIKPPSIEVLEERLRQRGTETEESLRRRLDRAVEEMRYGETPGNFDIVVVNDCLKTAYTKLHDYIVKELAADDTRSPSEV